MSIMEIVEQIQLAIEVNDIQKARELLREGLRTQPSAELYYLGSKVALDYSQRISLLEKTIELDPFHEAASV